MHISKVFVFLAAVAATAFAFPGHLGGDAEHHVDYYAHPKYNYDYAVHDLHTGDVKNKWETRDGDVVKGSYTHNQPDGTILTVDYTSDKHNGYNAVVKKHGKSIHPEPVHHYHGHVEEISHGGHLGGDFVGHHGDGSSYTNVNNIALGHNGGHHY